jgi:aspartate carbamoyltransferase regulatory subunit
LWNIEHVPKDFLHVLTQITSKKIYIIKITLIFLNDFKIDIITLFDISASLNCIKEWIVSKWFSQSTFEKHFAANNTILVIEYKTQE